MLNDVLPAIVNTCIICPITIRSRMSSAICWRKIVEIGQNFVVYMVWLTFQYQQRFVCEQNRVFADIDQFV